MFAESKKPFDLEIPKNQALYEKLGEEKNPKTFDELRKLGYDSVTETNGDRAFLYPEKVIPLTKSQLIGIYAKATAKAPVEKQAWQMTMEELKTYNKEKLKIAEKEGKDIYFYNNLYPTDDYSLRRIHKESVSQAIKEGKPVSSEVLKDYPELAKKIAKVENPTISKELEPLAKEARKYKSAEEFISGIGKETRNIRKAKIGELVRIQSPTYGRKTATEFNLGVPREGKIIKINPKSVTVKILEENYLFPAEAKISQNLKGFEGFTKSQLTDFYNQATSKVEKVEKPAIQKELKLLVKEAKIREWQDIPELDAQIRTIKEPDPKDKDDIFWTVKIGLQESLGEQGGDIITEFYKGEPTLKDIKRDVINTYKEKKIEINKEVAIGVTAKSGRDEIIEKVIDKILGKQTLTR